MIARLKQLKRKFCYKYNVWWDVHVETYVGKYYRIYNIYRLKKRHSDSPLSVLFLVFDLATWKTQALYWAMVADSRFSPQVMIERSNEASEGYERLQEYLKKGNYNFLESNGRQIKEIMPIPDIIFYQKPYLSNIPNHLQYKNNHKSLFCFCNYAMHIICQKWAYDMTLLNNCWQIFAENKSFKDEMLTLLGKKALNYQVTGVPIMDEWSKRSDFSIDPWKGCGKKKRIIWAPHHTLGNSEYINYSTFLRYAEFMLQIANQYKEFVQFAFKPHPVLFGKLIALWGKEKTAEYYRKWAEGENTQLAEGDYIGLFNCSDAIIHDCASFIVEYAYACRPGLYLIDSEDAKKQRAFSLHDYARKAFELYDFGYSEDDIKNFVKRIAFGQEDLRTDARNKYVEENLLPPNGNTACLNIMNSIYNALE